MLLGELCDAPVRYEDLFSYFRHSVLIGLLVPKWQSLARLGIIITFAVPKKCMIMEKGLLKLFLGQHPESLHPADRQRFVDYVFECWKNGIDVDYNALDGLPQEVQQQLTDAVCG